MTTSKKTRVRFARHQRETYTLEECAQHSSIGFLRVTMTETF